MKEKEFFEQLQSNLDFPFEISEVAAIESNCGTVWIEDKNGKTYFITVQEGESLE